MFIETNAVEDDMKRKAGIIFGVIFISLAILMIVSLLKYATIFGFLLIYPYVVTKITGFGMNSYLAQGIGIVVAIPIWYAVFRLLFSWKKDRRMAGMITIVAFFALHSFSMFLLQGDSLVHPFDGPAMAKFCTVNPLTGEIQTFEQSIYDQFGNKAERCSPELIEKYEREKTFTDGTSKEVSFSRVQDGFISPATGKPLFFYCFDSEKKAHFFSSEGYCPWGGQLLPVSSVLVAKIANKEILVHQESVYVPFELEFPTFEGTTQEVEVVPAESEMQISYTAWFWEFRNHKKTNIIAGIFFVLSVIISIITLCVGLSDGNGPTMVGAFIVLPFLAVISVLTADILSLLIWAQLHIVVMVVLSIPIYVLLTIGVFHLGIKIFDEF